MADKKSRKRRSALILGIVGGVVGIITALVVDAVSQIGFDNPEDFTLRTSATIGLGVLGILGGLLARSRPTVAVWLLAVAGVAGFAVAYEGWLIAAVLLILGAVMAYQGRPDQVTAPEAT